MRKQSILKKAISTIRAHGVEIMYISDINLTESITNTFAQVSDIRGKKYLVRFDGKLWPPFSREHENRNLHQLQASGMRSYIIHNDPKNQFQISLLPNETKRLDMIKTRKKLKNSLYFVANEIRKLHSKNNFENNFHFPQVIKSSYERLSEIQQAQLKVYFQFILGIVNTLSHQQDFVPSHNDLIPSSIYVDRNSVTFVDLEYSANNIRSYDMALLSIKSAFTEQEEAQLISNYDPHRAFNMQDALTKTKPAVYFLLFLWSIASNPAQKYEQNSAFVDLYRSTQKLLWVQSGKMLRQENQLATTHSTSVGIYWGTFDPATLAHLNIALTAMQKCNLSKLIIVINDNTATGKKYHTSGETREALWNAMLDNISIPANWRNRIDIVCQTDAKPFSYQTAKKQHSEQPLLAIVGQDSFEGFKKYKSSFGSYDHILVVPRGDRETLLQRDIDQLQVNNVSILPTDDAYVAISSTRARDIINMGQNDIVQIQLHPSVMQNIRVHGLFVQRSIQNSAPIPSSVHLLA